MEYNTTSLGYDSALRVAHTSMLSGSVPLLIGKPGVGKTNIAEDLGRLMDAEVRHLRLNNIPPEDALGLQYIDEKKQVSVRYLPDWVPAEDGSDGNVIIFLDELTQAPDEYRKGIMSALNERYIGNRRLPDNCYFIAAGNTIEDGTNVHDLDTATADRFCVIKVRNDVISWANNYAAKAKVNIAIVAFLRLRPDKFGGGGDADNENAAGDHNIIQTSPRTWIKASRFLDKAVELGLEEEEIVAGIAGHVGQVNADAFWQVHGEIVGKPTIEELMVMNDKDLKSNQPTSMDMLWAYGQSMIWYANTLPKVEQVVRLLDRMSAKSDIPYAETRSQIFETIAKRARHIHGLDLTESPEIGRYQINWNTLVKKAA